jgi:hypothetical protein
MSKPDFAAQVEKLKEKQAKEMQELLDWQAKWDSPEQKRGREYVQRTLELSDIHTKQNEVMYARQAQERQALKDEYVDLKLV